MCSSVDYWRCRWIKLGGALEYPQRGPSDPHLEPDLSTVCPQGYPQGWRADPQGWRGGTRRCGGARASPRRRREHRRAGPTGWSASRSPCGRAGPAPPLRLRLAAVLPRHRSPRAVPSARSPWRAARYGTRSPRAALSGRSRGGLSEAGGSRKDDAPSPPHPDARSDRGARRRTASGRHRGPGSGRGRREPSGSMRARPRTSLRARSSLRVLRRGRGWAIVTMRRARAAEHAPPRARMGRWRAVRRLKKVAGAYLSPLALRHFRPEVAQ